MSKKGYQIYPKWLKRNKKISNNQDYDVINFKENLENDINNWNNENNDTKEHEKSDQEK